MNIETIAKACHEANRSYCQSIGDDSQQAWEAAPQWQKDSAIAGVKHALANPDAPPSASHESWLAQKKADGWRFGPVKDVEKKEHPCFVPYDALPPEQRKKDEIFLATVRSEVANQQPAPEHIIQFFNYLHLPPHLQEVSAPFHFMAHDLVGKLPRNPERTVALRKLLEAKDAAVRALLAKAVLMLAVLSALCLAPQAFADAPAPAPTLQVVQLSSADLAALLQQAQPATSPAAPRSMLTADGVGAFSWQTIAGWVGSLLALLFAAFKSAGWVKARGMVEAAAEAAWLVAERAGATYGLKGADKAALALAELYKAFTGRGIALTPGAVAQAQTLWAGKSAAAGLAAPAPEKLAQAQAAASVATTPGTATDLADKAAR